MGQMRAFGGLVALCRFLRLVIAAQIGLRDWPSLVAFFALHSPSEWAQGNSRLSRVTR